MPTRAIIGDAGRAATGFGFETNDCTVRALVNAFDIPYPTAHAYMASHGRKPGKGARVNEAYDRASFYGFTTRRVFSPPRRSRGRRTLAAWLRSGELPKRCIIHVNQHLFAVVDGVVRDSFAPKMRWRVDHIWEVA